MIDTHCHLDFPQFAGRTQRLLKEAAAVGVGGIINPGTSLEASRRAVDLAEKYPNVWAAVGVHPTDLTSPSFEDLTIFRELAASRRVVAIGEVGLDYHHVRVHPDTTPSVREQQSRYEQFLLIAEEAGKPVIIHAREAHREALAIARAVVGGRVPLIFHSFDGSLEVMEELLSAGAWLGFNNMLGYPKNQALRAVAAQVPLERILLETDAPFLPPADRRGTDAEPADVRAVAQVLAEVKGIPLEKIDRVTTANATELFRLVVPNTVE